MITHSALADYPIASHRYLADPSTMVYNGRLYVYCSNDDDNSGSSYAMKSIVCVSTVDLKNWTDHGEVFRVPTNASWSNYSWAPAAASRNGKIYLYFGNNASGVGVASSTSPTGPFSDAKGGYLVNSSTPGASGTSIWYFDPSVFIDDNGQAYLTFGGNGESNCRIIRLNSDMISVSGSASTVTLPGFFEASFLHKRNGLYYLSYSTNTSNGLRIDYATSSSPMSGYTRRGIAAGQPPSNQNNNHAAIVNFNGAWYHLYHNRVVSRASGSGVDPVYHRNLAVDRLNYNGDGTIQQVTYTTDGVPQIGTLNPYTRVEAETFNAQSHIETERCSEGGMDVGYIQNGDWIRVRGVNFGSTAARTFSARVASATSGGNIEIRLGSSTGTLIGTCPVTGTGGWQTWTTKTVSVISTTGTHDLYLKFTGGSGFLLNFNWWQFAN
ncbi:MAG TPA: glycoside hydrolase family 43 protein [Opitutaceae bacterium]|nr:glycoside hydrolase family 43 protein [Opitutaceae bacterium]